MSEKIKLFVGLAAFSLAILLLGVEEAMRVFGAHPSQMSLINTVIVTSLIVGIVGMLATAFDNTSERELARALRGE